MSEIEFTQRQWKNKNDPTLDPNVDPELEAAELNRLETALAQVVAAVNAGGIGGGGSGLPPVSQTLFIQEAAPNFGIATKNSMWVPLNSDGTVKDMSLWQFYTGFAGGDGGNLFIQRTAPTPMVNALWIPLDALDKPLFIDQWQVFSGRSSPPASGNENLYISIAAPVNPISGSWWIRLNPDETPMTMDHWVFYTDP